MCNNLHTHAYTRFIHISRSYLSFPFIIFSHEKQESMS